MRVTAPDTRQRRNRAVPSAVCIVLVIFFAAIPLFSISFDEAVELERAGKVDEARAAYQVLLESGDDNYCMIISRLAGITTDLTKKRAVLSKGLDNCQDPARRHDYFVRLARIEEVSGHLESAQEYYQAASLAVPNKKDFDSLLSSAILLYESGSYRGAEAQATVIVETVRSSRLKVGAQILLSRIFFATEREEKALQVVRQLMREKSDELGSAALYWIVELAEYTAKKELLASASDTLLSRFPESPEAYMQRGSVGRLPSLSLFIGPPVAEETATEAATGKPPGEDTAAGQQAAGESVASETAAKEGTAGEAKDMPEKPLVLSVQTGSYSVRENAEYALKDLEAEGFTAQIRKRTVGNTVYYRVLIPDVDPEEVDTVIVKLKESGFEGFRVYE